jgi:anti-anti-sigma factor
MLDQFALRVQQDAQGRYAVLYTDGYINNIAGEKIGEAATKLLDQGVYRLVINMEKSTVINSIGISILIEIIEKMQTLQGTLAFCRLTRTIAKTFTIMGLTEYAEIFETEAEAIQSLLVA